MLVCERAEYQSSGTDATEWSEAIIDGGNSNCGFAALTTGLLERLHTAQSRNAVSFSTNQNL